MSEITGVSAVPHDFAEWAKSLPEAARRKLSIHDLRQIWEPMRAALAAEREAKERRDADWVLALGEAVGLDSGIEVPIVPDPDVCRRFLDAVSANRAEAALGEARQVIERMCYKARQAQWHERRGECSDALLAAEAWLPTPEPDTDG